MAAAEKNRLDAISQGLVFYGILREAIDIDKTFDIPTKGRKSVILSETK
jgi:hypothetical protein